MARRRILSDHDFAPTNEEQMVFAARLVSALRNPNSREAVMGHIRTELLTEGTELNDAVKDIINQWSDERELLSTDTSTSSKSSVEENIDPHEIERALDQSLERYSIRDKILQIIRSSRLLTEPLGDYQYKREVERLIIEELESSYIQSRLETLIIAVLESSYIQSRLETVVDDIVARRLNPQ